MLDTRDTANRLRAARKAAGYGSVREAADALQLQYQTYAAHENGNRGLGRNAELYARRFRVTLDWLLRAKGPGPDEHMDDDVIDGVVEVPVISMVSAGKMREQQGIVESDIERHVKVSSLPPGDWIGLTVVGDSMDRIAPDGALLVVNRADDRLLPGKFYIFALDNGEATFKRYMTEPDRLQPFSYNPDHPSLYVGSDDVYVVGRVRRIMQDV